MNYIIFALEFIVLIISIGLFFDKSSSTDEDWNINWGIALVVAVLFLFAMNASTICRGLYCFFSCGSDDPIVSAAKKQVAIYRRLKSGQKANAGIFGYENVDLSKLNRDAEEENLFLGVEDPQQIGQIAEQASKAKLEYNVKAKQSDAQKKIAERSGEFRANLARGGQVPQYTAPAKKEGDFLGFAKELYKQTEYKPNSDFMARQDAQRKAALKAKEDAAFQKAIEKEAKNHSPLMVSAADESDSE